MHAAKLLFPLLFILNTPVWSQSRKPLDHSAYDSWNRIENKQISPDGSWTVYTLKPENGDQTLVVAATESDRKFPIPRGDGATISADSRYVVFKIKPEKKEVEARKRAAKKSRPRKPLPDSLGILDTQTGSVTRIARVKSFEMPEKSGDWIAYLLESPDSTAGDSDQPADSSSNGKKKKPGTTLVLHILSTARETAYHAVASYAVSENGRLLAFATSTAGGIDDGVSWVSPPDTLAHRVMAGEGHYEQLVAYRNGDLLGFLSDRDDYKSEAPAYSLFVWKRGDEAAKRLAAADTEGLPDGWAPSKNGGLSFSHNGSRIFFGTAPAPVPEEEDDTPEDERVKVDVWHWQDPLLQPQQLLQVERERKRTYLAVADLGSGKVVQLADKAIPQVTVASKGDGAVALANTNIPYRKEISWDFPRYNDVYLIDVKTGARRRILARVQTRASLSPDGRYVTWFDRQDRRWLAQRSDGGKIVNLTESVPYALYDERDDHPYRPGPYGTAGWLDDSGGFLVYDRYDIWLTDPTGRKAARNITRETGRKNSIRLRYVKLDPEAESISSDRPLLLSAFNERTKQAGFYRLDPAHDRAPVKIVMDDYRYTNPIKARSAGTIIYTRESFELFPDILASASIDFANPRKISTANPQQQEYRWGTAELVSWRSTDGIPLQGILLKPDGFDPSRKYPMMVYFYERNSDNLHRHWIPEPHRSIINFPFYVSRGYLVFIPDIVYHDGYPGESALNAVVPGVLNMVARGFVDENNIGVQGHSWGGYQVAYLVTRTNLFKAAEAGAPVANMTSAYGGIRWGSGLSRMFQYEKTQSRLGGSLWEKPIRYLENSPLFWADKIETPLLIMHNDHDGAVPWYQGIELFVALRRLGKPAWLINYNGEPHWPTKYQNKKDWAVRMQQFFDHYLKGAPEPRWLSRGIPAIEKGKTLGYELMEPERVETESGGH